VISSSLQTSTEDEDEGTDHDGPFSSQTITGIASKHGTEECTASKD
jgi:hypothetical protein